MASASISRTEIRRGSRLLMVPIASSCFNWRLMVSKRTEIVGHCGAHEWHDQLAAWLLLAIGTWSRCALQDG